MKSGSLLSFFLPTSIPLTPVAYLHSVRLSHTPVWKRGAEAAEDLPGPVPLRSWTQRRRNRGLTNLPFSFRYFGFRLLPSVASSIGVVIIAVALVAVGSVILGLKTKVLGTVPRICMVA